MIFLALEPLKQVSADLNKANEVLALNPTHSCRIIFAFLYGYQLCQSTMVSQTFFAHTACGGEYEWRKCSLLYFEDSPCIEALLLVFVYLVDLA